MGLFDFRKKAGITAQSQGVDLKQALKFISSVGSFPVSLGNPDSQPAWENSVVMAVIKWVTRVFPESPLIVERLDGDQYETVQAHKLTQLLKRPNEYYSGNLLLNGLLLSLLVDGNAYIVKMRSAAGVVQELWYAPHTAIQPIVKPGSQFVDYYVYTAGGQVFNLSPADVIHLRDGIDPNAPYMGLSAIKSVARQVRADSELARYTYAILKNYGVPGLIITPKDANSTIDPGEADNIIRKLVKRLTGEGRATPVVIDGAVDIHAPGFSPKDVDVSAMADRLEARICAVMGLHPSVIGLQVGLEHSTFSNFAEARSAAYESLIVPLQQLITSELDTQLLDDLGDPKTERTAFDLSKVKILQEDEDAKAKRVRDDWLAGLITLGEARAAKGLETETAKAGLYYTDVQQGLGADQAKADVLSQAKARFAERRRTFEQYFAGADEEAA